ncbi:MAG: spore germination protein [Ruminococcaceae bacterium]|nr:spore germination protein [Oscillospiraceae bacterium]
MEIFPEKLTASFDENVALMDRLLRVESSFDLIRRPMQVGNTRLMMYYIDGFIQGPSMQKLMMHLLTLKDFGDGKTGAAERFAEENVPAVEVEATESVDQLILMTLSGCCAFLSEGFGAGALIIDLRTYPAREACEPENDRVMRGSRDGFVETLIFNTAMIRRRIRDTSLTVRYINVGSSSRTDMALIYMDGKADSGYVQQLTEKLQNLQTDSLVLGHQSVAESLIPRSWWNPFPKIRMTERPDAAAASLLEGSIILLCDNSPEAMIFPTSFFDFLQETDDFYFPPLTGSYLRILRLFVFGATVVLTPLWYLLLQHPAWIPAWLSVIVPQDPGALPILAQLILVEFALDGLKLAALNTPNMLSNSLSVVGGLLLGDFAVTVGWLSPDVILYMAFVGIANFTQSSYVLGYAFKYLRLMLLLLTALFDVWGFAAGCVLSVVLVAVNKTVNGKRSYLYPLIPFNGRALSRLLLRRGKTN